jgi:hypothetical protein
MFVSGVSSLFLACADTLVKDTLLFTVFGKAFNMLGRANVPAAPEDREQMAAWMTTISEQVDAPLVHAEDHG